MTRKNENKTTRNNSDVKAFIEAVEHERRRSDAFELLDMFTEVTGESAAMWGASIVGFGSYHYRYASGREGDFLRTGFSPRKQNLALYCMSGFSARDNLLSRLGKYKTGKACLYINKLDDIDRDVLRELIAADWTTMAERYPE